MTRTLALVLLGGRSRRFGRDKAALRIDGIPLLDRVACAAERAGLDVICVGDSPDGVRPADGTPWRPDEHPGEGPLRAIVGVLRDLPPRPVVLLPVDLPRLTEAHVRWLARPLPPGTDLRVFNPDPAREAAVGDGAGRADRHDRGATPPASPLPGILSPTAVISLIDAADRGERSLWRACRDFRAERIDPQSLIDADLDPLGFVDADDPDELARLVDADRLR